MSKKDLEDYIKKGGTKAMLALALQASAINAAAQNQPSDDQDKAKTEYVKQEEQSQSDIKTINLFDVATIERGEYEGENYVFIGDRAFDESRLDRKEILRDWKKDQKDFFKEAEPDRTDTISYRKFDGEMAHYDSSGKSITSNYIQMAPREEMIEQYKIDNPTHGQEELNSFLAKMDKLSKVNDPQSLANRAVVNHEEQHRTNDKLGIYAPGLSAEQYAVLYQYDEAAANVAELHTLTSEYKKKLKEGASKEDAAKVFENDIAGKFNFYKEALDKGLDPDSKEGKKLMIQGTIKMWQERYRTTTAYQNLTVGVASDVVMRSDPASAMIGNDEELQKRINKIFDNICNNENCKKQGIEPLGKMSEYLPEQRMELLPEVKKRVNLKSRDYTGLSAETREQIKDSLDGKNDTKKIKNLLKILTGRKRPEQVGSKKEQASPTVDKAVQRAMLEDLKKTY